jgi:parallel beta-helix repeat protein
MSKVSPEFMMIYSQCKKYIEFKRTVNTDICKYLKIDLPQVKQVRAIFFLCAFLAAPSFSHAITYYVDATAGNDSRDGTTIKTSWKTIAKVNRSKFLPGDFVLFNRGCTWREQLTIPSTGTEGKPITFGAYGTGAKPIISGADLVGVDSWALHSGNIYVATIKSTTPPTQLYVDGVYFDVAHHPNSGWLSATTNSTDTTSIIDSKLTMTADQIVGGTIRVKDVPWSIKTSTITSFDLATHKITLSSNLQNVMRTGYGYYLLNKLWMLDSPLEWHFDPNTRKLYLWTARGDSPSAHTVEISSRDYGVSIISNKNYITIQDLAVTKANKYDVYVYVSYNTKVSSLDVSGGEVGIYISCTSNSVIQNNSVQDTISNGIQATYSVTKTDISNNIINNAGNVGVSPKVSMAGIYVDGSTITVTNNAITNSGYIGIRLIGNDLAIQNNVVNNSCLVLDDCAGIYTAVWPPQDPNNSSINNTISGNTITNSIGNFSATSYQKTQAHGIYLDIGTHDTNVLDNTISNTDYGIFIHVGHSNKVIGNKVYGARMQGFLINENEKELPPGFVHDNVVTNNTFECVATDATVYYYSTVGSDSTKFGTFDFNRYYHPNSDFVIKSQDMKFNLHSWQQQNPGQDINSIDAKSFASTPFAPTGLKIK